MSSGFTKRVCCDHSYTIRSMINEYNIIVAKTILIVLFIHMVHIPFVNMSLFRRIE